MMWTPLFRKLYFIFLLIKITLVKQTAAANCGRLDEIIDNGLVLNQCISQTFQPTADESNKTVTVFFTTTSGTNNDLKDIDNDDDGLNDFAQNVLQWTTDTWTRFSRAGYPDPLGSNDFIVLIYSQTDDIFRSSCCKDNRYMAIDPIVLQQNLDFMHGSTVHQFFHAVIFSDSHGDWFNEGLASWASYQVRADLYEITTMSHYVNEVNGYFALEYERSLLDLTFLASVFWTYYSEQLALVSISSPTAGDAINVMGSFLRESFTGVSVFQRLETFLDLPIRTIFANFATANYAHTLSSYPALEANQVSQFQYQDAARLKNERGYGYPNIIPNLDIALDVGEHRPYEEISMPSWSNRYFVVRPTSNVNSLKLSFLQTIGFSVTYTILAIADNALVDFRRTQNEFDLVESTPNDGYDEMVVVVSSHEQGISFRYAFSAIDTALSILDPVSPTFVGDPATPSEILAKVEFVDRIPITQEPVGRPPSGLQASDFSIFVGMEPVPLSNIITVSFVLSAYWIVFRPPSQATDVVGTLLDLRVETTEATGVRQKIIRYGTTFQSDNVVVIDRSDRMGINGRLESAKTAASVFIDYYRDGDQVGVVSFNDIATVDTPLSSFTSSRLASLNSINGLIASGGASLGAALLAALNEFDQHGVSDHEWNIVLLSNGANIDDPPLSAFESAWISRRDGGADCNFSSTAGCLPRVHTIAIGNPEIDRQELENLSGLTGGSFSFVPDRPMDLDSSSNPEQTLIPTEPPTSSPTRSPIEPVTLLPTPIELEPTTLSPTRTLTSEPTTLSPTNNPTESPSLSLTPSPTATPTSTTEAPTLSPINGSTEPTTLSPTLSPTETPTLSPIIGSTEPTTLSPTPSPTETPTLSPIMSTTDPTILSQTPTPTEAPTLSPISTEPTTLSPTPSPSKAPSLSPISTEPTTLSPSPTEAPTLSPILWEPDFCFYVIEDYVCCYDFGCCYENFVERFCCYDATCCFGVNGDNPCCSKSDEDDQYNCDFPLPSTPSPTTESPVVTTTVPPDVNVNSEPFCFPIEDVSVCCDDVECCVESLLVERTCCSYSDSECCYGDVEYQCCIQRDVDEYEFVTCCGSFGSQCCTGTKRGTNETEFIGCDFDTTFPSTPSLTIAPTSTFSPTRRSERQDQRDLQMIMRQQDFELELTRVYRNINERIEGVNNIFSVTDLLPCSLNNDDPVFVNEHQFNIPITSSEATIVFVWNDGDATTPVVDLIDPDGSVREPDDTFRSHFIWKLSSPLSGIWTLSVYADDTFCDSGLFYLLDVAAPIDLFFDATAGVTQSSTSEVTFVAVLTEGLNPLINQGVTATIQLADGTSKVVSLRDDGNSNDGQPNDGVYASDRIAAQSGNVAAIIEVDGTSSELGTFETSTNVAVVVPVQIDSDNDGIPDSWEDRYETCGMNRDDPDDASQDFDGDGLENYNEYQLLTNPCNSDTDGGGESDGSELITGTNPASITDDVAPCMTSFVVTNRFFQRESATHCENAKACILQYTPNPTYTLIHVYRSSTPRGSFVLLNNDSNYNPALFQDISGTFRDELVTLGQQFCYRIQGVTVDGHESCLLGPVCTIPSNNPLCLRSLLINGGEEQTKSAQVVINIQAVGVNRMRFSTIPSLTDAIWEAYAETITFTLNSTGYSEEGTVYAQFEGFDGTTIPASASIRLDIIDIQSIVETSSCAESLQYQSYYYYHHWFWLLLLINVVMWFYC